MVGPHSNSIEIDVTESIGLGGTQTCGEISLMPGTSPEGAKLGRATCSSTHVAIDMSLKNNAGSLPLDNLLFWQPPSVVSFRGANTSLPS